MKIIIFANPKAGKTSIEQKLRILEPLRRNIPPHSRGFCLIEGLETKTREEFQQLLASESKGLDCAIIAGGDGTFSDALNHAHPETPLGYIPLGRGNALEYALRQHKPKQYRNTFRPATVLETDILIDREGMRALFYGMGFDGYFIHLSDTLQKKGIRGNLAYLLSLAWGFTYGFKRAGMNINTESHALPKLHNAFLCFVSKHPYQGWGTRILPKASLNDGFLHGVMVNQSRINILRDLVRTHTRKYMSPGHFVAQELYINAEVPMPVQRDGEYVGEKKEIYLRVEPRARKLIL